MSKKDEWKGAIEVLMRGTGHWMGGAGVGLATRPGELEKAQVADAVVKLWDKIFSWPMQASDLTNMGFDYETAAAAVKLYQENH